MKMEKPLTWQEEFAMTKQNMSFLDGVFDGIRGLGVVSQRGRAPVKSFPEKFHPRRSYLYRPLQINHSVFFHLKSQGVPTLTAYFLSDMNNKLAVQRIMFGVHGGLSARGEQIRDDALGLLK